MKLARRLLPRLTLISFGVFAGTLLAEVAARLHLAFEESRRARDWNELRRAPVQTTGVVTLGRIIRPSDDPRLVYELIPGLRDVVFRGHGLAVNPDGFRGPSYPHEPDADSFRIVGIGDSMMFGLSLIHI